MSILARFTKDGSGNVAMLFSLALVPILGLAGAAVDYARASSAKATLTAAIDAAALMAARDAQKLTDAQLRSRTEGWIRANLASDSSIAFEGAAITIDRSARQIRITANASLPASLTRILGQESFALAGTAHSGWGTNTIELALVLDNTGSMASSGKMDELKKATKTLIDEMEKATTGAGAIKVAIVPFATQVRLPVGYKNESWLRFDPADANPDLRLKKADWKGCVSDRDAPNDTRDAEAIAGQATLYPGANCKATGLSEMIPLSDNWNALRATAAGMKPDGNTNISIGVNWGMATLSPGEPFTEAKLSTTPRLTKYMIVLTDGDNTENRFTRGLPAPVAQPLIDPKTRAACDAAKAAGIKVYTIRVINGNAGLLRDCASDPSMYYDVKTAAGIGPVISGIVREISAIRLTM